MNDPLATVQSLYACFGRDDLPGLLALLDDSVRWQFIGDRAAPYTGTVVGKAPVAEWFGAVASVDDVRAFEPRQYLVGTDHVTVLGWERCVARATGRPFEAEWVHVWRLQGGRVTAFVGQFDSEAAARAHA